MVFSTSTLPLKGIAFALVGASLGAANPAATLLPGASPVKNAVGRVVVVERPEEQVYLVSVKLEQTILADAFPVYPIPGGVLIPLGEFSRLVQFAIDVQAKDGLAAGWFIDPKRTFAFDALRGTIKLGGQELPLDPQRYEVQTQDIFVDARLLAEWFPLSLDVDLRQSTIVIRPKEMLPIQARWKRDGQAGRTPGAFGGGLESERKNYVPIEDPYRWADVPSVDQTFSASRVSRGGQGSTFHSSTMTTGDLLGMEHQAYLGLTNFGDKKRTFRMNLGRRDPGAGLLGPMRATQFMLGEVTTQGMELISGGSGGTGFMVSNHPMAQDFQFDRRSFRGILPPGWQVELYQNATLLAIQTVTADGLYEFLDVPVSFGPNEHKLLFYGPQGQRRQEIYRSDVNPLQVPKGDFRYRVAALEASSGTRNGSADGELGLTPNLTLGFSMASINMPGSQGSGSLPRHQYTGLLLRSNLNFLASQISLARMETGALGALVQMQSGLGDTTFNLRHAQLQEGFESPSYRGTGGGMKSRTEFMTDFRTSPFLGANAMFVGFGVRREASFRGSATEGLTNRIATGVRSFHVSNELSWMRTVTGKESTAAAVQGSLSVSRLMRAMALRGSLSYKLGAEKRVDHFSVAMDKPLENQASFSMALTRDLNSGRTSAQASYQRLTGTIGLGANVGFNPAAGWQTGVFLRTTFTRDEARRRWNMTTTSNTGSGSVNATAFVDLNGNGKRDADEPTKAGVGFLVNGFSRPNKSDATGSALATDLPSGNYAYVKVDNPSIDDPLWRGTHPGFRFVARGGHTTHLELPVAAFSELDGTIFTMVHGRRRETPGLLVELLDQTGKAIRQIRSAFDGYFTFQDLPHGTYTLRINPVDAERRGFKPLKSRIIQLKPAGSQLDAQDLEVEALPPKPGQELLDLTGPRSAPSPAPASPGMKATPAPTVAVLGPTPSSPEKKRIHASMGSLSTQLTSPGSALTFRAGSQAIKAGQLDQAITLSQAQVAKIAPTSWMVRVILARQQDLLQRCADLIPEGDVFLLPLPGRAGNRSYQLLVGPFETRAQAQIALQTLPKTFSNASNRPFLVASATLKRPAAGARSAAVHVAP